MRFRFLAPVLLLAARLGAADAPADAALEAAFKTKVGPFLQTFCVSCHGTDKPEGDLDLSAYLSLAAVRKDAARIELMLERLEGEEMPPKKAKKHPSLAERHGAVAWFQAVRDAEIRRNAGDPGIVLARRLNNAEYNYTIRDLTGVDLQPTREFPIDPANTAGFDNSGESLAMTPSLLNKYLKAAREVADAMYLKPEGFGFAPHPMIVETDRDKFVVHRIIDFYRTQNMDYADYFAAAWAFQQRAALGQPHATLAEIAVARKVSPKYLATVWETLEGTKQEVGPFVKLQALWQALPTGADAASAAAARKGAEEMRAYVKNVRAKVEPRFLNLTAGGVNGGSQVMMIWKNVQYATHRRKFDATQLQHEGEPMTPVLDVSSEPGAESEFGPGRTVPVKNEPGDPDLAVPAGQRARYEAAWAKFCSVFPDRFIMEERGRNYFNTTRDRGRYLSAGFHSDMGYFRDDQPLYELILDAKQQRELDAMWFEMDFVASTTARMYIQFNPGRQRGGRGGPATEPAAALSGGQRLEMTSEPAVMGHLAAFRARASTGDERGKKAVEDYFTWINTTLRTTEKARLDAEPSHLDALLQFAARAYRRPLTGEDKADLLAYYRSARMKDRLTHEAAVRETLVAVLMSPDVCYRIDLGATTADVRPLSDIDLASRLSYFLWSSLPDAELMALAEAGKLRDPQTLVAQARRMLRDPRARALAVEFGGSWLDFRRFDALGTVDTGRFPTFTAELKQAMGEEPVRFMLDVFQNDRSVLDFLHAPHTFVNPVLAKHYGMPAPAGGADSWTRVDDANRYGRGGLLGMAAFMTKNAPGLRTSPVKRGYWVVKHVLGEHIPAPPPNVPELPTDEAKLDLPLREMLARHRADPGCASCHARFDSFGLVFEGFGPIGERREKDLAGRAIDASAPFAGGERTGLDGLRAHIREKRPDDFTRNLSRKLLAYALNRSPLLSDDLLVQEMQRKLAADGHRFSSLVESIVTSPQFLNKRGRAELAAK